MSEEKKINYSRDEWKEKSSSFGQRQFPSSDDGAIWQQFKEGNESAFIHIYNCYFEELCQFGLQFAEVTLVEDCVQDLFIYLRRKREKLPLITSSIRLFLYQSLKRRIFNALKKNSYKLERYPVTEQFNIVPSHETLLMLNLQQKEQLEKLNKALAGLNEKQREVVYYYFYKGMSYEDIQQLMGYDHVKSARNMVYRIIGKLKEVFLIELVMLFFS
ncbi:RNA polymerase sigma factor [Echinicola vietnamensis]|uniref:RNA polymerase sigma factor, sigma-70 family n=1 Tax=Echinicola vietnamensis (strain DSM 17526 / LMG 23754 / KMM 6221) TaxID=926556 RepID=L0FYQ4_ECHVK|nr:RNA polymerase sigma factor [Echinicola vietnamensis]AGA78427.1 RNA polymerase sigma factor, sigma-70 family [Echinicola vietnamensis DSM 17526]